MTEFPKIFCCEECPGDDSCDHDRDCVCGDPMDAHSVWCGHSPVSMHSYYGEKK